MTAEIAGRVVGIGAAIVLLVRGFGVMVRAVVNGETTVVVKVIVGGRLTVTVGVPVSVGNAVSVGVAVISSK